jgi:hypothetical protein
MEHVLCPYEKKVETGKTVKYNAWYSTPQLHRDWIKTSKSHAGAVVDTSEREVLPGNITCVNNSKISEKLDEHLVL